MSNMPALKTRIFKAVCAGMPLKEIAKEEKLSYKSVRRYLGELYREYGVKDLRQLVIKGIKEFGY